MPIGLNAPRTGSAGAGSRNLRIVVITVVGLIVLAAIGLAPRLWRERQLRASVTQNEKAVPAVAVASAPTHRTTRVRKL